MTCRSRRRPVPRARKRSLLGVWVCRQGVKAPVPDTRPFATRRPTSAPGTTPPSAGWAILEAPVLDARASRSHLPIMRARKCQAPGRSTRPGSAYFLATWRSGPLCLSDFPDTTPGAGCTIRRPAVRGRPCARRGVVPRGTSAIAGRSAADHSWNRSMSVQLLVVSRGTRCRSWLWGRRQRQAIHG